eukprot:scaffold163534_cov35-Tisochrysis_lutea.AAC.2
MDAAALGALCAPDRDPEHAARATAGVRAAAPQGNAWVLLRPGPATRLSPHHYQRLAASALP